MKIARNRMQALCKINEIMYLAIDHCVSYHLLPLNPQTILGYLLCVNILDFKHLLQGVQY